MKNEYKIDYVSIPDEGDMGLKSFGNNRGELEWGQKGARAGPEQTSCFAVLDIFAWGALWATFGTTLGLNLGPFHSPFLTHLSL